MFRKRIFKILVPLAMFALFMVCATPIVSAEHLNAKIASGQYVQKVDAFEVIFDATETMNEVYKGGSKLNQEKALITLLNDTIPNLKLNAAARAFGQFTTFGDAKSKILFAPTTYSKSALPQAIAPFTKGKGFSPLDAALDGATVDLQSQSGQLAVIAFSDGQDMEKYEPVAAAQRMKKAYGDRVCIYTVVLGDKAAIVDFGNKTEGMNVMKQVADAGACGFMVTGESISTPAGMADFVEKVFLARDSDGDGVADYLDKCPDTPKGVAVDRDGCPPVVVEKRQEAKAETKVVPTVEPKIEEPVSMTLNIWFAKGKYNIQPQYEPEIKKVADFMKAYPDTKAVIAGHTDNVASRAFNMKLSQNRANSVKNYLVEKYNIDASRFETVGYGEDKPVASNKTKIGKQKNRRVTATFSNVAK